MKKLQQKQTAIEKFIFMGVLLPDEEAAPAVVESPKAAPAKPVPAKNAKDKGKQPVVQEEAPKPVVSPLQLMKNNIMYKNDGQNDLYSEAPYFRFMPANKEVMQRLIVRACNIKSEKDLANFI
jgi:hypothetical protein